MTTTVTYATQPGKVASVPKGKSNSAPNGRTKKKNKKGKGKRKGRPARKSSAPSGFSKHADAVCTILNPFCDNARGSLYPDHNSGRRLAFQVRGLANIGTTDASGNIGFWFSPTLGNVGGYTTAFVAASNYTPPAVTSWTTYASVSSVKTYGSQYRIVSWGVVGRIVAPVSLATGTLIATEINTPTSVVPDGSLTGTRVHVASALPGTEFCWTSSPQSPLARDFRAWYDTAGTLDATGEWTSLFCQIKGGPATQNVVQYEYYFNIEVLVDGTSAVAMLTPPPPLKTQRSLIWPPKRTPRWAVLWPEVLRTTTRR